MKKIVTKYLINIAVSLDQCLNALAFGDPDETLSSRMGKAIAAGRCKACRPVCWLLSKIQKDHCAKSAAKNMGVGADEVLPL